MFGAVIIRATSGAAAIGAIGAVVGEMTPEAVVKTFLNHQLANPESTKNLTNEEARQLAADLDRLKATGVDLSKLSAGLAAALAGKDIDTAATTGCNAAEHNMFVIITVVLELMDKGLQAYDAYLGIGVSHQKDRGQEKLLPRARKSGFLASDKTT